MNTAPDALHFHGPFTFVDHGRGIATSGLADSAGLYLWVLREGEQRFIHYVGETVRFLVRHKEHLTQILGLNYGIFRADAVAADDPAPIFRGMWRDRSADARAASARGEVLPCGQSDHPANDAGGVDRGAMRGADRGDGCGG